MKTKFYFKSEIIFAEGSRGDSAYIVEKGKVGIYGTNSQGQKKLLAVLRRNAIFGEMAVIDNFPRTATAVAMENCEVSTISQKTFKYLLQNDPFSLQPLLKVLSRRLRETTQMLQED